MRQMVGLIRRGRTFYFRRTIPAHIRPVLQEILTSAGPSVFRRDAVITLRGTRASREFWVSLRTTDEAEARRRAISLEAEAEALLQVAERRARPGADVGVREIDDATVQHLAAVFRSRKLFADDRLRRGHRPMTREEHAALDEKLKHDEALARDMIARGDFSEIHFDADAIFTLLDAGIRIEYFSNADRRIHHALNDAWLETIEIIKGRQAGIVTATPVAPLPAPSDAPSATQFSPVTAEQLHEMWRRSEKPTSKTAEGFLRKLTHLDEFLHTRDRNLQTATTADASLWKLGLLQTKSDETVANYVNATKAIIRWGCDNGHLQTNFFASIRSHSTRGAKPKSGRRGFTDDEAAAILKEARNKKGYRRWVPWIAHFTGARLSEICQLEKSDIVIIGVVPHIFIQNDTSVKSEARQSDVNTEVKRLKTANAERKIPIHSMLIAEGFLGYVAEQLDGPLFKEITPDRYGSRGGNATKVLSRWLRNDLNITDPSIASSHSFRHRFVTLCRNAKIEAEIRHALVGHSNNHISDRYGESYLLQILSAEIEKIPSPPGL